MQVFLSNHVVGNVMTVEIPVKKCMSHDKLNWTKFHVFSRKFDSGCALYILLQTRVANKLQRHFASSHFKDSVVIGFNKKLYR